MLKQCFKLAAFAGIALFAGNCSQQNPISMKSGGSHSVGEVGQMAPIELETVADLSAGSGQVFLIMKAGNGQVYYKCAAYPNFGSTGWTNTGYYANSNIVALNCGSYSWVIFEGGQSPSMVSDSNIITLNNFNGTTTLSYVDYFTGLNGNVYVKWPTYSQLAAAPIPSSFFSGFIPMIFGRGSNNTLYANFPPGVTSSPLQLSTTTVGYNIAAATLSSPYGTNGLIQVFAVTPNSNYNLLTIAQTAQNSNNYGTWQSSYTNLGGDIQGNGNIVVGKDKAGYLEVFACNGGDYICHNWQTGASTWSGWTQMSPACGTNGFMSLGTNADGRLELFFASAPGWFGGGGQSWIAHQWQQAPNSAWDSAYVLTGANGSGLLLNYVSPPLCVTTNATTANGNQDEYVFTIQNENANDSLWYTSQIAPNGTWNSWSKFY